MYNSRPGKAIDQKNQLPSTSGYTVVFSLPDARSVHSRPFLLFLLAKDVIFAGQTCWIFWVVSASTSSIVLWLYIRPRAITCAGDTRLVVACIWQRVYSLSES